MESVKHILKRKESRDSRHSGDGHAKHGLTRKTRTELTGLPCHLHPTTLVQLAIKQAMHLPSFLPVYTPVCLVLNNNYKGSPTVAMLGRKGKQGNDETRKSGRWCVF